MTWPVEYSGHEYQPIPESWIDHPNSYHREQRGGPRLFAVSAVVVNSRTIRIRYLHPTNAGVLVCQTAACDVENGVAPAAMQNGKGWPHSLHPGRSDAVDVRRACEVEHFAELWVSRLDDVDASAADSEVMCA